jgi:hypothetical protein
VHKKTLTYLHLPPNADLPALADIAPFQAILLLDAAPDDIDELWRFDVCRWLVAAGCRYLLAWGTDCETWREGVEDAALEAADYEDVAPEQAVLTSAHEDEELDDVFWFARHRAAHPGLGLERVVIVHVAPHADRQRMLDAYDAA